MHYSKEKVVVVSGVRTAIANLGGSLKDNPRRQTWQRSHQRSLQKAGGLNKNPEDTDLVRIQIEKRFYRQLEETAKSWKQPDKLYMYNAILLIIKSLNQ